ncbi:APC family permease [Fluviicola sp.]|uniref:APC family permease n=1 Tax=Fluviicola sp. TaxID=1917219 RepID=UPI0031D58B5C
MAKLKRTLGLTEAVFFGTGSILGAGIYAIAGKVAGFSGNMIWLSFAIASLTALMSAFSYAELSSMFPSAGGEYVYAKHAFNRKMAVALGLIISINGMISGSTVAIGFAGYFSQLLEINLFIAALGIICLVWLVNVSGIRQSSIVNIIFTIIEFCGLVLVIYAAYPYLGKVDYLEAPPGGFNHILLGAALSYFAYIGFEEIVKLSEETKSPEKNIPKALFLASSIVMVVYLVVAVCAVSAIPWKELGESKHPLADVVNKELGKTGVVIISVIALFSTTNTILSNMMGSSRVLLYLGKENKKLNILSVISGKRKTPVFALILAAGTMIAFAAIGKLETVALIANFFIFITFLFVNIAVLVLRKKKPGIERPYKVPVNIRDLPIPSILGILLTLLLLGYSIYGLTISAF